MGCTIGILRHSSYGHAEQRLKENIEKRGHNAVIVDPFKVAVGINPAFMTVEGAEFSCNGLISRCEINSPCEQATDAYLRLLEIYCSNLPVINGPQSIMRCQDKFRTHYLLEKAGLPTPRTAIVYSRSDAHMIYDTAFLEFPIVIKKPFGGRGADVHKVDDEETLERLLDENFLPDEPILLQEYKELERHSTGERRDIRAWTCRDKYGGANFFGAVYRIARNGNFRTNSTCGGYVAPMVQNKDEYPSEVKSLAKRALDILKADVAGVDIARDADGNYFIEEVNISFDTGPVTEGLLGNI